MTKSNITEYDKVAANNTDVQDVPLGENQMYPSDVNNAFREIMADLAAVNDGTVSLTSPSFAAASLTGNLSFGDNNKAIFGAGSDLQIYHSGSNSIIADNGSGKLVLSGNGTTIDIYDNANGHTMASFVNNGAVNISYQGSTKLATTATGIDVTGTVTATSISVGDSHTIGNDGFDNLEITSSTSENIVLKPAGSVYLYNAGSPKLFTTATGIDITGTVTADGLTVNSGATDEVARFEGTGSPYISWYDTGVRQAYIGSFGNAFEIVGDTPDTTVRIATGGTNRVTVNSTGIDVTGTVTADGLTVDGDAVINLASTTGTTLGQKGGLELFANSGTIGNGGELTWQSGSGSTETWAAISGYILENNASGSRGHMLFGTKNASTDTVLSERMRIASNGDISFYEGTGTTPKFFWDASAESLGIGTSSPSSLLHISGGNGSGRLELQNTSGTTVTNWRVAPIISGVSNNGFEIRDVTQGASRFVIDSSGNVGIGTGSPDALLEVAGTTNDTLFNLTGAGLQFELRATSGDGGTANSRVYRLALDYLNGTYTNGFIDFYRGSAGSNGYLAFGSSGTEAMRIDSSGRVGIGTSSPSRPLHVYSAVDTGLYLQSSDAATSMAMADTGGSVLVGQTSGALQFYTGGDANTAGFLATERMRITSGGDLLISTTSNVIANASSSVGTAINAGLIESARAGVVAQLNRQTSDGSVIEIQKSGTTVGSIGTVAGDIVIGTGTAGLRFWDSGPAIQPRNSDGSANNDAIDLGISTSRFKDLHLSGTAYAGGLSVSAASGAAISVANTGTVASVLMSVDSSVNSIYSRGVNSSTARDLRFMMGSTERLRIDSSGRVGIGTSSPSSLIHGSGLDAELRLQHTGNSYYQRIFTDSSNNLKFGTGANGTERMRIDASGNLGIGTSSPSSKLHVSDANAAIVKASVAAGGTGVGSFRASHGTNEFGFYVAGTNALVFYDYGSNAERMRIDSSGNVGIGTSSPTYTLDVNGTGRINGMPFTSSGATRIISTHSNSGLMRLVGGADNTASAYINIAGATYNASAPFISFANNGSERMFIDSNGNVGIGTSSPSQNLHVSSSGDTVVRITSADGNGAFLDLGDASDPDGGRIVYDSGSNLTFSTASTERVRIKSDGKVGIGTSSPLNELHISSPNPGIRIEENDKTSNFGLILFNSNALRIRARADTTRGSIRFEGQNATDILEYARFTNTGAFGLGTNNPTEKLHVSGNILATGNITAYSDERLKSDIKTLDGSKVYEMRGVSYIKDGEASSGVIAQELQKVAPELVSESGEYLSVAYGNLVGYLIEAVKELKAEVEELKNASSD